MLISPNLFPIHLFPSSNALRSVRVGGSVVYSTCTMSPTQNEVVVENAAVLARQHYGIECVEQSLKRMERHLSKTGLFQFSSQQQRGSLILPWIISNFGPMYVCKLQRIK
jgi:16S rRNA C967 or C1407 C5-methylase (RsmB/RsmF family)